MTTMPKLTYEERLAFDVVRKAIRRKPELANALMEGMAKEVAVNVLLQTKKELADLLAVSNAFTAAAGALSKREKGEPEHVDN